jgi:hypothetical protein
MLFYSENSIVEPAFDLTTGSLFIGLSFIFNTLLLTSGGDTIESFAGVSIYALLTAGSLSMIVCN